MAKMGTRTNQRLRLEAGFHGIMLEEPSQAAEPVSLTPKQLAAADAALQATLNRKRLEARANG